MGNLSDAVRIPGEPGPLASTSSGVCISPRDPSRLSALPMDCSNPALEMSAQISVPGIIPLAIAPV